MPEAPPPIERLKKRPDFLAAAKAHAASRGAVVLQGRRRADETALIRVGFTAFTVMRSPGRKISSRGPSWRSPAISTSPSTT